MISTLEDATATFKSVGLFYFGTSTLTVGEELLEGGGIRCIPTGCFFQPTQEGWRGLFPSDDPRSYEVLADLDSLVSLTLQLYSERHASGVSVGAAFRELVEDADAYLVGDGVPRVKPSELRLTSPAAPTG